MSTSVVYNMDCMEYMRTLPDKAFDLAIVDPPYGDGGGGWKTERFGGRFDRYRERASGESCIRQRGKPRSEPDGRDMGEQVRKKIIAWDIAPDQQYFDELFRVSRNQIIWGANYFRMPPTRCFVVWRKLSISENFSMAMAEYAWTSFWGNAKVFECAPQGTASEPRIHPTQKPVALYKWLLARFAGGGGSVFWTPMWEAVPAA